MEIERKWIASAILDLNELSIEEKYNIEQAYLLVTKDIEIRIRKKNDEYFLTQKSSGDLVRQEFETPITKEIYEFLLQHSVGKHISKCRYIIPYKGFDIELDIFDSGLRLAEVEFCSVAEAENFVGPKWFVEEVTNDKCFKNKYIAGLG